MVEQVERKPIIQKIKDWANKRELPYKDRHRLAHEEAKRIEQNERKNWRPS